MLNFLCSNYCVCFFLSSDWTLADLGAVSGDRPVQTGFGHQFGHALGLECSIELLTNGKWDASNPSCTVPIK